jgi:hypothetical protein
VKWAIVSSVGSHGNYFRWWTGIGPCFGGTPKTAATFATKQEALREVSKFPWMVVADAVKLPMKKKPS